MTTKFRFVWYISGFFLLLLLAGYSRSSNVLGQTIPAGTITVTKDHLQNSSKSFKFEIQPTGGGTKIKFKLRDGQSKSVVVSPGTYVIEEESSGSNVVVNIICGPSGTLPSDPDDDDDDASVQVTVTSGGTVNCTFQNSHASRIRVQKYNDVNGNGTRDNKKEKFLKNWVFTVKDSTGTTVVAGPKKTNSSGNVAFESLAPGSYIVCETFMSGWTNTQPGGTGCYSLTLVAGQEALLIFGNRRNTVVSASLEEEEGVYTTDAAMEVNPALADGIEIVYNPDEEYGPEWDDAPDATFVNSMFIPYVTR